MKKFVFLFLGIGLILTTSQCKKNQTEAPDLSSEEARLVIQTDQLTEDVISSVEDMFQSTSNRPSGEAARPHLPSCVTVTYVVSGDTLHATWQFDTSGCQMPNGRVYTDTIDILRIWDRQNHQALLEVNFSDDFTVDGVDVDGSFTRTRIHRNAAGHPESNVSFDIQVTWPNGDTATRTGTRTREWVEGYDTPGYHGDDAWLITGNWHIVRRNGDVLDITVTTPLRKEFACRYFVSGVIEIVKNGQNYTIDFGNGTCDNEATLTLPNGQTVTINL